ncbi:MAG: MFS transporter [Anaerolineae bacterium]
MVGFILTWDNIINMFFQPWVGSRSDRTHTRFGRRKPWLMLGAPMAALFFILVPFVRENFILIALAILGTNLGMALFRSPTIAYLGDLFQPEERSKANGVINLMGGVGRRNRALHRRHALQHRGAHPLHLRRGGHAAGHRRGPAGESKSRIAPTCRPR